MSSAGWSGSRSAPDFFLEIVVAVGHQIGTVPVVLKAEVFEKAAEHAQPAHAHQGAPAGEQATAWEPENGIERTAYTLLADLLTGIRFALLLAAGLALQGVQSRGALGSFGVLRDLRLSLWRRV